MLNELSDSQRKPRQLANLFFVLALLFGLLLILLEPPFVCPDENAHFINICRISRGELFAQTENGQIGSVISVEEFEFLAKYGGKYNGQGTAERFDYQTAWELMGRAPSDETFFFPFELSTINPVPYLFASIVVSIMRFLLGGINAYEVLLFAKLANLFFYAFVIRWALMKTGAFRHTMFLLALMPMSLFQGASTSYDAILIPASFLLFAYATKILCSSEEYLISREDIIAICFASAFLFGCKIAYGPLVLILLSICVKKFGSWKRWGICVGAVVGMAVVFYLLPTFIIGLTTRGAGAGLSEAQIAQKEFFNENVLHFSVVIDRTLEHFGTYWIETFFGILGWLDTRFPRPFLFLFALISTFNAIMDACSTKGIRLKTRVLSLAGVAIFFVGTLYAMYVDWTPELVGIVGGDLAYGGQGRYFIPVALFTLIAVANPLMEYVKHREWLESVREKTVCLTALASVSLTVMLMVVRYWA